MTPFVIASVAGSTMIVNRLDYDPEKPHQGVGIELLEQGRRDPALTMLVYKLALARRGSRGDGVVIIDGGANIGSYTVEWAKLMGGWGHVYAFEPQQWPFAALCGNLAINNCFNVTFRNEGLDEKSCTIDMPFWQPDKPCNFGSLSLHYPIPKLHEQAGLESVRMIAVDDMALPRLDILKLDVEGMEPQVIKGAFHTIDRLKPVIIAEAHICTPEAICDLLPDYAIIGIGADVLCVHKDEANPELQRDIEQLAEHMGARQVR
jgi:FkbM family methyltransferase